MPKEISANYCLVAKLEEPKAEGFQTVEVQDSFVYKGKIVKLPGMPVHLCNKVLDVGEIVVFAKYSPDTVEIEFDGVKHKFVKLTDLLAVL